MTAADLSWPYRSRRRAGLTAVAASAVLAALAAPGRLDATATPPGWLTSARAQLTRLAVKPALPMSGYTRSRFGPAWSDLDGNRCDTRDDILKRDLTKVVFKAGSRCVVLSGILHDPYTGKTIRFRRGTGTSSAVQIDHVVALAAAWRTGASTWSDAGRLTYANDPLVLLAVDGAANEAKADADASSWLPPRLAYRCRYVARQLAVKTHYHLWLTPSERGAIAATLDSCAG